MTAEPAFIGAKIALIRDGRVLTHLRDDLPGLPFAGHWDFPGGGREGDETEAECALRELHEEYGLILPEARLIWRRDYPSHHAPGARAAFFGGHIEAAEIDRIVFGGEGQCWEMMPIPTFLSDDRAIPYLQVRLRDFLAAMDR